jgi:hypothetical protein
VRPGRRIDLVATRANGQPAFATYAGGHVTGLLVLTLAGDYTRFDSDVVASFGLEGGAVHP